MQNTVFNCLAVFLVILVIATLVSIRQNETITGYAVSNIFLGVQDQSATLGFVARESQDTSNSGYKIENFVLMPSGEFSAGEYTVTIPYLGMDLTEEIAAEQDRTSSGGGGQDLIRGSSCEGSWQCGNWGECQPSSLQYRVCIAVSCEYTANINMPPKPSEVKGCEYKKPATPVAEPPAVVQPPVPEKFEFYVIPKVEKKYTPGEDVILHTYINNPGNKLDKLEIEYNIDDGTERTMYVEYEGVFDVQSKGKFSKDIPHSLDGYQNKKYRIHATLYKNGEKVAESYHDLDLS